MKFFRKVGLWFIRILGIILALVILYLIMAIILTLIPVNSNFNKNGSGTDIFISSNGVHTNIIIPSITEQYNWAIPLKFDKQFQYLAFGWGDKDFYINTPNWSDLKVLTTLKAAFLPTSSVIQVYGLTSKPSISKSTKKIYLNDEQLKTLSYYIYNSFYLEKDNRPVPMEPAISVSGNYKFYKAKGKYTIFFTCNNWTSKGLKQAGIKNSVWAPFDKSVLYHLD